MIQQCYTARQQGVNMYPHLSNYRPDQTALDSIRTYILFHIFIGHYTGLSSEASVGHHINNRIPAHVHLLSFKPQAHCKACKCAFIALVLGSFCVLQCTTSRNILSTPGRRQGIKLYPHLPLRWYCHEYICCI